MRPLFLIACLAIASSTYGQHTRWQLSIHLQPEVTFYQNSYSWWAKNEEKQTNNLGFMAGLQYNLNKRFFLSSGLSFISRKLHTANFLNQAALPPPKQSFTMELVTTKSVSYRLISIPVNLGFNFISTDKIKSFVTTGFSANYLINTYYRSNFSRYDGAYKKMHWQGYSITVGLGTDFKLTNNISASTSLAYALQHKVRADEYLLNQNGNGLPLKHSYLNLGIGVKIPL